MKAWLRSILWLGLIISFLLSFQGIKIRMTNEGNNKNVKTAVDFKAFEKAAKSSGMDMDEVLDAFIKAGANAVALREVRLSDLQEDGKVFVLPLGEYMSGKKDDASPETIMLKNLISKGKLNPSNYVVIPRYPEIADFLKSRLESRLGIDKVVIAGDENKPLFYIDHEIDAGLQLGLGFDERVLEKLKEKRLDIILRPLNSPFPSLNQMEEYRSQAVKYSVKYLIFDGPEVAGYPGHLDSMLSTINEGGMIFGIIEALSQVGYVEQKGLEELIEATGYAVNRVYITPQKDLERLTKTELLHRWIRCVVDRNIRFIYIDALADPDLAQRENINNTISAVKNLNNFISSKGYNIEGDLNKLSPAKPNSFHNAAVLISLFFGLLLYLVYLFRDRWKVIFGILLLSTFTGGVFIRFLGFRPEQFMAMSAAVLYPSFSSLLVLIFIKKNGQKPVRFQLLTLLGIVLGVNILGAYTVVTILPDIRYTMNTEAYKGVLVSFSGPLLLFALNYYMCFVGLGGSIRDIIPRLRGKQLYFAVFAALAGGIAVFLYLARSGNDSGIAASQLELKVRELLQQTVAARPRFKEFLIGYPALFATVVLFKRFRKEIIIAPLGLGVVMGSVSIVNSFCHVFTSVEISFYRTINGLILGLLMGLVTLLVLKWLIFLFDKFIGGTIGE